MMITEKIVLKVIKKMKFNGCHKKKKLIIEERRKLNVFYVKSFRLNESKKIFPLLVNNALAH